MGFVCLPVSIFLYWLMLRPKKESQFPERGLLRLVIAGAVTVVLSVLLSMILTGILESIHLGAASDFPRWIQAIHDGPEAFSEFFRNAAGSVRPTFLWALISMFFTASLLEEGLKFLTYRIAIRKDGMIRTWMDAVIAFSIVGIIFCFGLVHSAILRIISAFRRSAIIYIQ